MKNLICTIIAILAIATSIIAQQNDFPKLTGPYLGQKPPGLQPEQFAPGIVSTDDHEFSCAFSPDGNEFYFSRMVSSTGAQHIMYSKLIDGSWSIVLSQNIYAQNEIPNTPAGKRLKEVIHTINSGKYEIMRSYVKNSFDEEFIKRSSVDRMTNYLMNLYNQSEGFDCYGPIYKSKNGISANLQNRYLDIWQSLGIEVDLKEPHKITSIIYGPGKPPENASTIKKIGNGEIVSELESFLDKLVHRDIFSGTVLFAKNEKILLKKAYGAANKESNLPNQLGTKFNLGSMNKMFTAVAIGQLVEKGKLSFSDKIGKYLNEDWIKKDVGKKVRIEHLLTHTSGLGDYLEKIDYHDLSLKPFKSLDDFKPFVIGESLKFKPGKRWSYSNTGYLLLGVIIEKIAGQSYYEYVNNNIYIPAGMINTLPSELDNPGYQYATGYDKQYTDDGVVYKNNNILSAGRIGGPAGGGYSTVEDLFRFAIALKTNKLISGQMKNILLSEKPKIKSRHYGYGFQIRKYKNEIIIGHSGSHNGISAVLDIFKESGYTIIVLSNYRGGSLPISNKLSELLLIK